MSELIEQQTLESLLYRSESATLDFKRDQYPLGDDRQKSEFVKDVLAFANAWRDTDAIILIGVDEVASGRNRVEGVTHHLDESSLQQLVNGKTNKPIKFDYSTHELEGKDVGVLRIASGQERPFFLKKKFGRLEPDKVYIRRGSSTDVARPDEIASMGREAVQRSTTPTAELRILTEQGEVSGSEIEITSVLLVKRPPPPKPSPDEEELARRVAKTTALPGLSGLVLGGESNATARRLRNHWAPSLKDCREYHRKRSRLVRLRFEVRNVGSVALKDLRVAATIEREAGLYIEDRLPKRPGIPSVGLSLGTDSMLVEADGDTWSLIDRIRMVRPGDEAVTDPFYLGADNERTVGILLTVTGENLPVPLKSELVVQVKTVTEYFTSEHEQLPDIDED